MEEKFNWDLPADPDPKSDNYYNGIVSKELKDPSSVGEILLGVIHRESVTNQSDFVNEGVFTSFRALANSQGATRINIEGEYESELKDIAANGQTFTYFGEKCRISAKTLNR